MIPVYWNIEHSVHIVLAVLFCLEECMRKTSVILENHPVRLWTIPLHSYPRPQVHHPRPLQVIIAPVRALPPAFRMSCPADINLAPGTRPSRHVISRRTADSAGSILGTQRLQVKGFSFRVQCQRINTYWGSVWYGGTPALMTSESKVTAL